MIAFDQWVLATDDGPGRGTVVSADKAEALVGRRVFFTNSFAVDPGNGRRLVAVRYSDIFALGIDDFDDIPF